MARTKCHVLEMCCCVRCFVVVVVVSFVFLCTLCVFLIRRSSVVNALLLLLEHKNGVQSLKAGRVKCIFVCLEYTKTCAHLHTSRTGELFSARDVLFFCAVEGEQETAENFGLAEKKRISGTGGGGHTLPGRVSIQTATVLPLLIDIT